MSGESEETALYRIFGDADLLLYIGISNDFGRRWKQHAKKQPWWPEKRRMTTEWYDSRDDAERAEEAAIRAERPVHNKRHAIGSGTLVHYPNAVPFVLNLAAPRMAESDVLALPACVDLPTAARAIGVGRTRAYELARTGEFPCEVLNFGGMLRVTQASILAALGIENPHALSGQAGKGQAA